MILINLVPNNRSNTLFLQGFLNKIVYLTFVKMTYQFQIRVNSMHDHSQFFLNPTYTTHKLYESLRMFYVDHIPSKDISQKFGWSEKYFNKIRYHFHQALIQDNPPQFFIQTKPGSKEIEIEHLLKEKIIELRKTNHSIQDIQSILNSQSINISLRQINKTLKETGFLRLPKRTIREKQQTKVPEIIDAPKSFQLDLREQPSAKFNTRYGGVFFFLPIIKELKLSYLIEKSGYPETEQLTALNYILSLIFLKLIDKERLSHINDLSLDSGAGLFAGLNVLPKSSSISSYSYKTNRTMNRILLKGLYHSLNEFYPYSGDINLDFTIIPHWGEKSVLEKNWSGTRRHALKSVLALVALDPDTGFIPYGNAEIKHRNKDQEILQFIDFWKELTSNPIKCLIFDSKFTTYENLNLLNKDGVKFITLRRRGKNLVDKVKKIPSGHWHTIQLDTLKRKYRNLKVHESKTTLKDYEGKIRQLIVTNHGRKEPAFIITNDLHLTQKEIVTKYARRWLVEKSISEQIDFFHLNLLSSSIVIKVDFDLTMTIVAHTLYRLLAQKLTGFENVESKTIYRKFIDNLAEIQIKFPRIDVKLLKKVHYPILFENELFKGEREIPWLNNTKLSFGTQNTT
jgi:hypothetical protein